MTGWRGFLARIAGAGLGVVAAKVGLDREPERVTDVEYLKVENRGDGPRWTDTEIYPSYHSTTGMVITR